MREVNDIIVDFVVPSPSGLNRMSFADQLGYYHSLRDLCLTLEHKTHE